MMTAPSLVAALLQLYQNESLEPTSSHIDLLWQIPKKAWGFITTEIVMPGDGS